VCNPLQSFFLAAAVEAGNFARSCEETRRYGNFELGETYDFKLQPLQLTCSHFA